MTEGADTTTLPMSPRAVIFRLWSGAIPASVCAAAIEDLGTEDLRPSHVQKSRTGSSEVDPVTRQADHVFLESAHWVGAFPTHFAHEANELWQFDLSGGLGTLSYIRYQEGGHFTWHVDALTYETPGVSTAEHPVERKLSVTVNLSDPDDYDGGELEFMDALGRQIKVPEARERGSVVVFPSTVGHRVTPVTRGERHVLVAWMFGHRLR